MQLNRFLKFKTMLLYQAPFLLIRNSFIIILLSHFGLYVQVISKRIFLKLPAYTRKVQIR